jgi:hypothetical protein
MPIGARISGWVAANGRAIINADASLDLLREIGTTRLSRCLSVPVVQGINVLGVASLYLDDPRGFSEHDLLLVEAGVLSLDVRPLVTLAESLLTPPNTPSSLRPTVH